MKARIELSDADVKLALREYIAARTGVDVEATELCLEVKSARNYKAEWEQAAVRVSCSVSVRGKD